MPGPLLIPLIAAGSQLASSGINAASQSSMNKKTRKWNEKMHNLQRGEALADFQMQNEYNSPQSQMARLKSAGLNPNLVYGNGAIAESANVRPSPVESWSPQAPRYDIGGAVGQGISTYYDQQIKQVTIDNLKAQNTVIEQEALLKAAQTISTSAQATKTDLDVQSGKFDLQFKTDLRDISAQAAEASLNKTKSETKVLLDRNEREMLQNSSSLKEAIERILKSRSERETNILHREQIKAQIRNLDTDNRLKILDERLKDQGIQPHDPIAERMAAEYLYSGGSKTTPSMHTPWRKGLIKNK